MLRRRRLPGESDSCDALLGSPVIDPWRSLAFLAHEGDCPHPAASGIAQTASALAPDASPDVEY